MSHFDTARNKRLDDERTAYKMLDKLHALSTKDVQLSFFGQALTPNSAQLLTLHAKHDLPLDKSLQFVEALINADVTCARIDIALALRDGKSAKDLQGTSSTEAKDVVLYGFGRIGRILARLLLSRPTSDNGLQLKAIVLRPGKTDDLAKRASLLERDSVHGWFAGSVLVDNDNNGLLVNGRFVQVIYASDPSAIDYTKYGINNALLIDNTGKFKDQEGLSQHLTTGIDKVLLTAPASGDIKNVVFGVNEATIGDDTIVSAASCTTNAITPILKLLNDEYGVVNGHMETIHAYTNDQNLVDNHHKADRRGRAASLNMVMTSTGAAKAVGKALPELAGKLTGNAIRVPTPNVSLAVLTLNLAKAVTTEALNAFIYEASQSAKWQQQIAYSDSSEAVSTDFVGSEKVAIFDAKATLTDGQLVTLYVWYDNEMGYSTQVVRVAETMAGVQYQTL